MNSAFITSHNFKDYMKEAVNIYVASSFLSRAIIDDIKATLNQLPFKGGKNFKFLLNEDFHENSGMRKVLINMLLELPNTEVRIYKGARVFHAKLYIFESGNNVFTTIGSFNATAGGAGRNIEAGIKITDREIYRQAKAFFNNYWVSKLTEKARYNQSAEFVERKFNPGDSVITKHTQEQGVILTGPHELIEKEWVYSVFVGGRSIRVEESNLKHLVIAKIEDEHAFQLVLPQTLGVREWKNNYVLSKAFDLTDKILASFAGSRTETYHYQFWPLFKILQSRDYRILIADEVGLGKTIEAGIILKEFSSRNDMLRSLIIVPNSLKEKWKDEMQIRFDEYYEIISASDLLAFLEDYKKSPQGAVIKGIISYDQMVVKSLREKTEEISDNMPFFDMIIIDEAHHLKNEATYRHRIIRKFTQNSNVLIMLTATPIQLRTKDLFSILAILLGDMHTDIESIEFSARLTVNERINQAIEFLKSKDLQSFQQTIHELRSKRAFKNQLEHLDNYQEIMEECLSCRKEASEREINRITKGLYSLNILNQNITRTLRKDVSTSFPDRNIKTQEYEYTDAERELYDAILGLCRRRYAKTKSALAMIMPERRAASSLVAMKESLKTEGWELEAEEYRDSLIELDDDRTPAKKTSLQDIKTEMISTIANRSISVDVDSKLEKLKLILDGIFNTNQEISDKKIMIFCTFIATINYLKSKLRDKYPDAYVDSISGQDKKMEERIGKKELFTLNNRPAILICSEVAGEGLDFQFCHYLINYDMPWNPSKLEQRVGRIDRLGQKAEKVTVFNLVNRYTIEDHIMAKLFERVKLFNSTIGPLGEILGRYQKKFSSSMLRPKRTEKEKEAYEKKILENIGNQQVGQKAFEEKQLELLGVMDYFYDEVREKRLYFQEDEIKLIWDCFVEEYKKVHDLEFEIKSNDRIFSILVDSETRKMFTELINKGLLSLADHKKKDYYKELINSNAENKQTISYTFNHKCALEKLRIQFLNISHPFIRGALRFLKEKYKPNKYAVTCRIFTENLPWGHYVLFIYRFDILNCKNAEREFVEERFFALDSKSGIGSWQKGEILVREVTSSGQECQSQFDLRDSLKNNNDYLNTQTKKAGETILDEYRKISCVAVNRQRSSLHNFYSKKIKAIKESMRTMHERRPLDNLSKEIQLLEEEKAMKMSQLGNKELRLIIKCTGIIHVINKEV